MAEIAALAAADDGLGGGGGPSVVWKAEGAKGE